MDDYDDVQNWLSLSEVNTKESLSVGGRKLAAPISRTLKYPATKPLKLLLRFSHTSRHFLPDNKRDEKQLYIKYALDIGHC